MTRDVVMGYAHNGNVRQEWHASVMAHGWYDRANHQRLAGELGTGGPYIADNRCRVVARFLETDVEWLWFTDVDVVFPPFTLDHMLEHADPIRRPILGALYFTRLDADGGNLWLPTWMEDGEEFGEYTWVRRLQLGEVRELTMVAMGCTLIHRSVLLAMHAYYGPGGEGGQNDPQPWFGHDIVDDPVMGPNRIGEDVTFCRRARSIGYPVHGVTFPVGHMKVAKIGWDQFIAQQQIEGIKSATGETMGKKEAVPRLDLADLLSTDLRPVLD